MKLVRFTSYAGGQGRTVAAALTALARADIARGDFGRTVVISDSDDIAATLGVSSSDTDPADWLTLRTVGSATGADVVATYAGIHGADRPALVVLDLDHAPTCEDLARVGFDVVPVVVVRPHYVALRRTVRAIANECGARPRTHVVTFAEADRAITPRDVATIVGGTGETLTIPRTDILARLIDAGLLLDRAGRADGPADLREAFGTLGELFAPGAPLYTHADAIRGGTR
jgi:hypothetical protein